MSPSIELRRAKISEVYPSDNWRLRVQQMSANQVAAIYKSMLDRGVFAKKIIKEEPVCRQMTIFDFKDGEWTWQA